MIRYPMQVADFAPRLLSQNFIKSALKQGDKYRMSAENVEVISPAGQLQNQEFGGIHL